MSNFKIVIDSRETNLISNFGDDISTRNLHLGDIAITDDSDNIVLVIERKTLADLRASVFDGRYREQKKRLTENFSTRQILYVIESNRASLTKLDGTMMSTIVHSTFRDGLSILFTKDCGETAYLIKEIHRRVLKHPEYFLDDQCKTPGLTETCLKKHKTDHDIQIGMLSQIPGISTAISTALIERFSNIRNICESLKMNPDELNSFKVNNRKMSKTVVSNITKHLVGLEKCTEHQREDDDHNETPLPTETAMPTRPPSEMTDSAV